MRNLLIKQLLLIAIIISLVSCNQLTPETENQNNNSDSIQNLSTDNLTERVELLDYGDELGQFISIQQHCYPGTEIPISAKFMVDLDFVNLGFKFEQVTSEIKPDGRQWSDRLTVPGDIPVGEYEIAVTGVPSDGSGALTLYAPIEVKSEPELQLNYDCRLYDEPQTFTVISEAPLDLVRLTDQDGTIHTLTTKDNYQFSTEVTLKGPNNGKLTLEAYDKYGLSIKDSIFVYDSEEIRICRPYVEFRVDGGKDTLGCISYNTQGKDERYDFVVEIPDHIDFDYRTRLMEHPGAVRGSLPLGGERISSSYGGMFMGASPNGEWVIYSYVDTVHFEEKHFIDDDGFTLSKVYMYNFVLINTITGDTKLLGTRYNKYGLSENGTWVDQPRKENGPFYYVIKWTENNEVYILEQIKEETIYRGGLSSSYINMSPFQTESPHASARIVRMTLPDMVMHPTEYEPPRAWVGYADQKNGIIGYTSPSDDCSPFAGNITYFLTSVDYRSLGIPIVSNISGTSEYHFSDLSIDLLKDDVIFSQNTRILGSGYINEEPYTIFGILYDVYVDHQSGEETIKYKGKTITQFTPIFTIHALNMNSGKVFLVSDTTEFTSYFRTYCKPEIRWSNIDNKIYFFTSKRSYDGLSSMIYLASIGENMDVQVVDKINSTIFTNNDLPKATYIKKGGWYND